MKKILLLSSVLIITVANAQWAIQNSAFPNANTGVNCISIPNSTVVWASAFDSSYNNPSLEFTMTSNAGSTWTAGSVNGPNNNFNISCISGVDANTAWVSVDDWNNGGGRIYKTTDGGSSWTRQNNAAFNGADGWADDIYFWNANEGVCVGDSNAGYWEIYTTVDGGTNWTRVPQGNIPANLVGEYGGDNVFSVVGNTIWFGSTMGRVFKSIDKGVTWTVASTSALTAGITSLAFKDANNGLAEDGGTLENTTDGGATWNDVPYNGYVCDGWMCAAPGTNGFYVSSEFYMGQGETSYSTDDGFTWTDMDVNVDHGAVMFLNTNTGWSGGWNQNSTTDGMFVYNGTVGIANQSEVNGNVSVFPNPFNSSAVIKVKNVNANELKLEIYDLSGKSVRTQTTSNGIFEVLKSDLPVGGYLYRVSADGNVIANGKLMVE